MRLLIFFLQFTKDETKAQKFTSIKKCVNPICVHPICKCHHAVAQAPNKGLTLESLFSFHPTSNALSVLSILSSELF